MRVIIHSLAFFLVATTSQASPTKTFSASHLSPKKTISATITAYTPAPQENSGRGTRSSTAIGTPIRPGIVAVSRDLLRSGWDFGDRVHIKGLGVFTIEDTMHHRFRRTIDVAVPNQSAARRIGVLRDIAVTLLERSPTPQG